MKRFLKPALALVAALILLIGIAYFIRVPSVHSDAIYLLFTNPDGTACDHPCLFGVQPGKTLYADALPCCALIRSPAILISISITPRFVGQTLVSFSILT